MEAKKGPRESVDRVIERLGLALDELEDARAPRVVWAMLGAAAEAAADELRWWREIQDQEFRE